MAVSNYLSTKSQQDLHLRHRDFKAVTQSKQPIKTGLATFLAFIILGFVPLLSFVLALFIPSLNANKFVYSFILTGVALLVVGFVKGRVVQKHPAAAALETLLVGGIAAAVAYIIGFLLKGIAA